MTKNWEGQTEARACMQWEFSRVRTAVCVMYPAQGVVQVLLNGKNEKEEHACISVGDYVSKSPYICQYLGTNYSVPSYVQNKWAIK